MRNLIATGQAIRFHAEGFDVVAVNKILSGCGGRGHIDGERSETSGLSIHWKLSVIPSTSFMAPEEENRHRYRSANH